MSDQFDLPLPERGEERPETPAAEEPQAGELACGRPRGCRTPYGCAGIKRCWWSTPRQSVRIRRGGPATPRTGAWKDPNQPEPGYWLIRVARKGPLVAACIRIVESAFEPDVPDNDMRGSRSPQMAAFILDEPVPMERVWHAAKEVVIDEVEHRYRVSLYNWARQHAQDEPIANPRSRIDLAAAPPVYQRKG